MPSSTSSIVVGCSGVYRYRNFDIHKQAADFVRFILGVSSPDDSVVGFDKNIYWQGKQRGLGNS